MENIFSWLASPYGVAFASIAFMFVLLLGFLWPYYGRPIYIVVLDQDNKQIARPALHKSFYFANARFSRNGRNWVQVKMVNPTSEGLVPVFKKGQDCGPVYYGNLVISAYRDINDARVAASTFVQYAI